MTDERAARVADKLWATGNFGLYSPDDIDDAARIIAAEYADVLAENEWLRNVANCRICSSCMEHHPIDSMCPPHECRTTGQQWFRDRIAALEKQAAEQRRGLSLLSEKLVAALEAKHVVEIERDQLGSQASGLETLHAYIDDLLREKKTSEQQVAELRSEVERWKHAASVQ